MCVNVLGGLVSAGVCIKVLGGLVSAVVCINVLGGLVSAVVCINVLGGLVSAVSYSFNFVSSILVQYFTYLWFLCSLLFLSQYNEI